MKIIILKKINKFLARNWQAFLIIFIALSFFMGASVFNYKTQNFSNRDDALDFIKWASPDETANYLFAKLYAQENKLTITENYNLYIDDIIRPRSFRSDFGQMKPVSFLGVILIFGKIGQIFSYKVIPYLTPFFAAIGIFYFYLLIKKLFGKNNALLSAIMLAFFPPYFYYSSRSMFHNILFIVMLIIGLYYALMMVRKCGNGKYTKQINASHEFSNMQTASGSISSGSNQKRKVVDFFKRFIFSKTDFLPLIFSALAGLFLGLAIITRSSELLWLGPLLLILWIFNIRKVGIIKLIIFLAFLFLALLPVGYYNQILYGNFYYGGYGEMNRSITNVADASSNIIKSIGVQDKTVYKDFFYKIKDNVLFFGFHPGQSLKIFYKYFFNMFGWLFWLGLLGFFWYAVEWWKYKYKRWIFLVSYFIISIILIYYYGSWEFYDNPDPRSVTIGNSYTRYWLPIYLGAMPLASSFIVKFTKIISRLFSFRKDDNLKTKFFSLKINNNFCRHGLQFLILLPIIFISFQYSLSGSEEGLIYLAQRQKDAKREWLEILGITESNSVIITQYHDKLIFPERKVIVGLFDDPNMIREYAKIAKLIPTYYYNFTFPENAINYLNSRRLLDAGLNLQPVQQVTKDFTLYKLLPVTLSP